MTSAAPQTPVLLPINKRDRIPQAAIDDVVKQIVEKFKPIKIILFGSYAYGKPTQVSDVDLLVIMDSPLREIQQSIAILQAIDYRFGLDLVVKTPASLSHRIELGDSFLREIIQQGKVLYERDNRSVEFETGS